MAVTWAAVSAGTRTTGSRTSTGSNTSTQVSAPVHSPPASVSMVRTNITTPRVRAFSRIVGTLMVGNHAPVGMHWLHRTHGGIWWNSGRKRRRTVEDFVSYAVIAHYRCAPSDA